MMARRTYRPPPKKGQVKKPRELVTNYCDRCAKMGLQEQGGFGIDGVYLCYGHWRLTAHYQYLKFREFYEVLSKEDLQ